MKKTLDIATPYTHLIQPRIAIFLKKCTLCELSWWCPDVLCLNKQHGRYILNAPNITELSIWVSPRTPASPFRLDKMYLLVIMDPKLNRYHKIIMTACRTRLSFNSKSNVPFVTGEGRTFCFSSWTGCNGAIRSNSLKPSVTKTISLRLKKCQDDLQMNEPVVTLWTVSKNCCSEAHNFALQNVEFKSIEVGSWWCCSAMCFINVAFPLKNLFSTFVVSLISSLDVGIKPESRLFL